MEHSSSSEANNPSGRQEIQHLLENQTVHYRFHKSPPLDPTLRQYNPVQTLINIALGYGLNYRGSRFRFPAGAGNFSLHHRVQNGSGAYSASYSIGTMRSFPGDKAAGS
jgi:hypothetical protein